MPQVFDTLHHDHEKVTGLFEKIKSTTDGAEKTRLQLSSQIKEELLAHSEFEEQVFYPAVKERGGKASEEVDEALREHDEVKQMLADIDELDPTSPDFMEAIMELEQAVLAHVRHEEDEVFPLAQSAIDPDRGEQMSKRHDQMVEQHMRSARD